MATSPQRMGRPRTREDAPDRSDYLGGPVGHALKKRMDAAAADSRRSLSAEMRARLDQTFAEQGVPPQFAALGELFARCMFETASLIAGVNRAARRSAPAGLGDPYVFDQAANAVVRLLESARPPGDPSPHGACARLTNDDGEPIGHLVGAHNALGFIEVLAGRHVDEESREALWIPRIREKLGAIAKRFEEQPEADDYWAPSVTEPARVVVDDTGQLRAARRQPPPKDE